MIRNANIHITADYGIDPIVCPFCQMAPMIIKTTLKENYQEHNFIKFPTFRGNTWLEHEMYCYNCGSRLSGITPGYSGPFSEGNNFVIHYPKEKIKGLRSSESKLSEFLDYIQEDTIENLYDIIRRIGSYAYIPNKTQIHYDEILGLIGVAVSKCEKIIQHKSTESLGSSCR